MITMIIFDLSCDLGHTFEGWFQSQENFEDQLEQSLISCPNCGSCEIRRVPSAVHLSRANATPVSEISAKRDRIHSEEMLSLLGQVLTAVISNSEDVGNLFAEEARRIHYLESPARPIVAKPVSKNLKTFAKRVSKS